MAARKTKSTRRINFAKLPPDQQRCVAEIVVAAIHLRIADRAEIPSKGDVLKNILDRTRESVLLQRQLFKHVDALNALLVWEESVERASRDAKKKRSPARSRKK